MIPNVLPGRAFQQIDPRSRLLFSWRAKDMLAGFMAEGPALRTTYGVAATEFSRASPGGLVPGRLGQLVGPAGDNAPRFEMVDLDGDGIPETVGLRLEGSRQNKCQRTYLHGGATTGWSKGGDAAATLAAVTDTAELAAAGLDVVCKDSYVLKLDNSGGATGAIADNTGATGNTNPHAVSLFARGTGSVEYGVSGSALQSTPLTASYSLVAVTKNPAGAGDGVRVVAPAGSVVYFVLAQMEEGAFRTTTIPNNSGSAVSRAAEGLYFPANFIPQPLSLYLRLVERGTRQVGSATLFALGDASASTPSLQVRSNGGAHYSSVLQMAAGASTSEKATHNPDVDELVELLVTVSPDGAVTQALSVEAGPVDVAPAGTARTLDDAWSGDRLYLNSVGASNTGFATMIDAKVAAGVQSMTYMREVF